MHALFRLLGWLVCIWLFGAAFYFAQLISWPQLPQGSADAAVVLTGGQLRVAQGLHLLQADLVPKILISGVHPTANAAEIVAANNFKIPADTIQCCIALDYASRNTRENAIEAARWAKRENIQRLYVVTADYHMARTMALMEAELPDTELVPLAVAPDGLRRFTSPSYVATVILEYHKWALQKLGVVVN